MHILSRATKISETTFISWKTVTKNSTMNTVVNVVVKKSNRTDSMMCWAGDKEGDYGIEQKKLATWHLFVTSKRNV